MTKFKLFSTLSATAVILAGIVYLVFGAATLPYVLATSAVAIGAMGAFHVLDAKEKGDTSLPSLIPAICLFVLSLCVIFAFVYSIIK